MKKLIKILGKVIAVVFALLIATAIAVTIFFDPNDYKGDIAAYVKEKTGRELHMEGDISLSLFPWIGLEIGKTELGNAPGFGKQPFASVDEVGVKVKLLPLLHKRVVMDTVILKGLDLRLSRDRKGRDNWGDLAGGAAEEKKPAQARAAREAGRPLEELDISGVRVSNAHVVWDDRQTGAHWTVDKLDLHTGQLGMGKPVDVGLAFDVIEKDARPRHVALSGKIALDMEKQTLAVSGLALDFAGVKLNGRLSGTEIQTAPRFKGHLKVAEFVPRRLLQELEVEPPVTSDATALGKAALETDFTASTQSAQLNHLVVKLDDTTLRGELGVSNFAAPAIRYKLDVDDIDVDRYLPPPAEQKAAQQPAAGGGSTAGGGEIPVDLLRKLNLNGTLAIGKLKVYGIRSEDIRVTTSAKDGNIRVHPASAKLYGGSYSGDVRVDARGREPLLSMDEKLTGVQAQPLFKDAAGWDWLSGTANLTAQLSGKGANADAIRRTLGGVITFAFTDGTVKGANVVHLIRKASATLRGEPQPPDEPQETDFAELTGSATVKQGVVTNRDLELKSPLLRIGGSGTVDLVREQLDYLLKAEIVGTLKGQGGKTLEQLKGVPIPVRITGSFQKPSFKVDLKQAVTAKQKARIEKKKKQLEEKTREKVKEKLRDLFK